MVLFLIILVLDKLNILFNTSKANRFMFLWNTEQNIIKCKFRKVTGKKTVTGKVTETKTWEKVTGNKITNKIYSIQKLLFITGFAWVLENLKIHRIWQFGIQA